MQFTFNLHQSWCFSALTTVLHLFNYVPFLLGLRTPSEREERLRQIPTAYNYRLQPPLKNITTQREAEELYPAEYLAFLEAYEPLKKAKGKYKFSENITSF